MRRVALLPHSSTRRRAPSPPLRIALATLLAIAFTAPVPKASPLPAWSAPAVAQTIQHSVAPRAIVPGRVDRTSLDVEATYDVDAVLSYGDRTIRATERIALTNRSGGPIDRLELNTIAARVGALRLGSVTVDGTAVDASVDDQTIVVPLGGVLAVDGSASVEIAFTARLRTDLSGSNWLFTRANGIVSMYRWIPWLSRRTRFDRPNHGDPFVTQTAPRVEVRLTTDRELQVAATGRRVAATARTQTFVAENVRDFVLTAATDYRTASATLGDTRIRVSYRPGTSGRAMLDAARTALRRMEALVGPYPYAELDIAQSSGGFGMEGPGVAWIPTGVAPANIGYLVSHEAAHQWFYGLVGNDQAREPFADEASADFLARHVLDARRVSRCSTQPLDRSIYRYGDACYYEIVYVQGASVLDDVRRRMGTARFFAALRGYLETNRHRLVHTADLLRALDDATPLDLAARLEARFPAVLGARGG